MNKVKLSLMVLIALVMVFVSACGNNSSNEETDSSNTANPEDSTVVTETEADPFGKYDNPVTLDIAYYTPPNVTWPEGSNDTLSDNRHTRLFEEELNIKFNSVFEVPQTGYVEKINLLIASNDLPDFFSVTEKQFKLLAESDVLEDMTQIYEDYASPLLKEVIDGFGPAFKQKVEYDGKMLGIPSTVPAHDSDGVVWLRTDWLENVGIELPQVITIDDLERVARAFVEDDPDQNGEKDTYGIQSTSNFTSGTVLFNSLDLVFTAYQSFPKIWTKDEDGNIVYGSTTPQTKDALTKLREWYDEGLLDKEFGTVRYEQFSKDISAGKAGISTGFTWAPMSALADSVKNDPKASWDGYILAAADGKYYARQPNPLGGIIVVKKGASNPEAIVKAINMTTEIDNATPMYPQVYADSPGTNWTVRPIQKTFRTINTVSDRFQRFADAAEGKLTLEDLPDKDKPIYETYLKGYEELKATPQDWAYTTYQFKGGSTVLNPVNEIVYNEFYGITDTMEMKWANLEKLEAEAFIRIITGDQPIDYFDTFVSEWKRQGGDEITQEVEKALEN